MTNLIERFFEKRIIPKKTFVSFGEAENYIKKTHLCWGGALVDENLKSDCLYSYKKGFLTKDELNKLVEEIFFHCNFQNTLQIITNVKTRLENQ